MIKDMFIHKERHHKNKFNFLIKLQKNLLSVLCFTNTRMTIPLRGPSSSSCGGLWPSADAFSCPSGKKCIFLYIYLGPVGHFW